MIPIFPKITIEPLFPKKSFNNLKHDAQIKAEVYRHFNQLESIVNLNTGVGDKKKYKLDSSNGSIDSSNIDDDDFEDSVDSAEINDQNIEYNFNTTTISSAHNPVYQEDISLPVDMTPINSNTGILYFESSASVPPTSPYLNTPNHLLYNRFNSMNLMTPPSGIIDIANDRNNQNQRPHNSWTRN